MQYIKIIQRKFKKQSHPSAPPVFSTISFPNGQKMKHPILKACVPKGIPTIVIHHTNPKKHQTKPKCQPISMNHKKLRQQLAHFILL